MISHIVRMGAITAFVTACAFLPYFPGRYDPLAAPLSAMAQLFAITGLALVPIGALWLVYEACGRGRQYESPSPSRGRKFFAMAALVTAALAWGVISLGAWALGGMSLGVGSLALGAYVVQQTARRLPGLAAARMAPLHPAPIYLIVVPTAVALVQFALAGRVADWSRERVIAQSGRMIEAIERHRTKRGTYPSSLTSLWNDYHPSAIGVERFRYEPSGSAFNLFFEHHTFRLGTNEIVVYNKLDEQTMTSHDADLLELNPDELAVQRGYYAVHDAAAPHWKYFWFD